MRTRVYGAILQGSTTLMVQHREGTRDYWTLPGGGIEPGGTPEQAVVHEVNAETGLDAKVIRFLFTEGYLNGTSQCFLLEAADNQQIQQGYDPEEAHLNPEARLLRRVAWQPLESMVADAQVAQVLAVSND